MIVFPVGEVFDGPVCYLLNRYLSLPCQNLGSSLAKLVLGVSSSLLREGSPQVNRDCNLIAFVGSRLTRVNSDAFRRR